MTADDAGIAHGPKRQFKSKNDGFTCSRAKCCAAKSSCIMLSTSHSLMFVLTLDLSSVIKSNIGSTALFCLCKFFSYRCSLLRLLID